MTITVVKTHAYIPFTTDLERARRPKTVVSHYLENPPKSPENEFAKD